VIWVGVLARPTLSHGVIINPLAIESHSTRPKPSISPARVLSYAAENISDNIKKLRIRQERTNTFKILVGAVELDIAPYLFLKVSNRRAESLLVRRASPTSAIGKVLGPGQNFSQRLKTTNLELNQLRLKHPHNASTHEQGAAPNLLARPPLL
jgi:hypothetical protein